MKTLLLFLSGLAIGLSLQAQIDFDAYQQFKSQHAVIGSDELQLVYARPAEYYYKGYGGTPALSQVAWLDSVRERLALSSDELQLLSDHHFFVSERMSYPNFGSAFHTIYANDLPVFISTDAILHALHSSYSYLLKSTERFLMRDNLEKFLADLYSEFPTMATVYAGKGIDESLADADLYLTIAYSLISGEDKPVRLATNEQFQEVMAAIASENFSELSLFCKTERKRRIDFSQFKVRGHYVDTPSDQAMGYPSLENYFRTMMWLGRIEFFMTPPVNNPWELNWEADEIKRMNITALLLNELMQGTVELSRFKQNETIVNYLVGESDNVTPGDLQQLLNEQGITKATDLLDAKVYANWQQSISMHPELEQKIMGGMLFSNPDAGEPDKLPLSFRLSGQRFIIDSYVLANMVYDRIIYEGKKVFRGLPDPLEAAFALGNSDAAYLLADQIDAFHYGPNLANMRYLIDHQSDSFWTTSYYNSWLGAIRQLNPLDDDSHLPFFMRTSAWHHQKLNTQLASWSQLRHDNLLYAKPSYTGMTGCSYPCSYVEPYPEFYAALAVFTREAGEFFSQIESDYWEFNQIKSYFTVFAGIMDQLEVLARKELEGQPFSSAEKSWLQSMLFEGGGSGAPPYSGWYNQLFANTDDINKHDYPVVDVHTQPTDEIGNVVGKVLHTGTGKINLGVFLIKNSESGNYTAYTGPFMSYHENVTANFKRLTDQDWASMIQSNAVERPEWTSIYLADVTGTISTTAPALPFRFLEGTGVDDEVLNQLQVYPNPVINHLTIRHNEPSNEVGSYRLMGLSGSLLLQGNFRQETVIDFSSLKKGLYLLHISTKQKQFAYKIVKE